MEPQTQTYLDEPPSYDFKDISVEDRKELIISDARSINSSTSEATTAVATSKEHFTPTRTLLINARGIRFVRLPMPSGQLEIPITDTNGKLVYVSSRTKKCSGNATLADASGADLLFSEYMFGPGREPKIRFLDRASNGQDVMKDDAATIVTKGKWTSRQQSFILPGGNTFTWKYVKERDAFASAAEGKDKRKVHLALEIEEPSSPVFGRAKDASRRRIAELVRNAEARTPGTSVSDAGNGGQLQIDGAYCESTSLKEEVVVASCLMMLKKEIDRRRAVQFAIIAGAAS